MNNLRERAIKKAFNLQEGRWSCLVNAKSPAEKARFQKLWEESVYILRAVVEYENDNSKILSKVELKKNKDI